MSESRLSSSASGSSPLARGARQLVVGVVDDGGLIPARAGSTGLRANWSRACSAHPRGEHRSMSLSVSGATGSSPLARGAPGRHPRGDRPPGLIPARAGSTRLIRRTLRRGWAHPRSRGEHWTAIKLETREGGSSPLARGAPVAAGVTLKALGLIPARAGSTRRPRPRRPRSPAHPRSRGEHIVSTIADALTGGSSPLARGARGRCHHVRHHSGLIPARAGSTPHRRGK